jgi:hypothetical protein
MNSVSKQLSGQVRSQTNHQVWDQTPRLIGNLIHSQLLVQVRNQVGDQVRDQVGGQVWDETK